VFIDRVLPYELDGKVLFIKKSLQAPLQNDDEEDWRLQDTPYVPHPVCRWAKPGRLRRTTRTGF
jgi:hypothetical protein